ncbi:glycosyltransferase family 4 protein [Caballeronia zhejiangensis]|nr:glycosyltransferase family 4 protein [Caballeronia zhejiangensis]
MRIAQIAPLHEAVPPKLYGGTERVVSYLTDALVDLGHDVTLFASGDSQTRARLEPAWPRALRLDPGIRDSLAPHMLLLETVRRRAHEFDVLHFHLEYLPFPLFSQSDTPFVTTLHGRLDLPELRAIFATFTHANIISISDDQRSPLPRANWLKTVYHGLPDGLLTPQPHKKPEYLAFLGRISPQKRADLAIEIAARSGLPLKIAAKVDKADEKYFASTVEPLLSQAHVEFIGEISETRKPDFLSGAKALLFPIDWNEPFGLVMIESMACGTPVIAFKRGAVPEVIDHGVTGFICEDVQDAVGALHRIDELSRARVRAQFERRFSASRMAQNYVDAYTSMLHAAKRPVPRWESPRCAMDGRRNHWNAHRKRSDALTCETIDDNEPVPQRKFQRARFGGPNIGSDNPWTFALAILRGLGSLATLGWALGTVVAVAVTKLRTRGDHALRLESSALR